MRFRAFVILMSVAALAHGADMYRWVDEKGIVNYASYPPPQYPQSRTEKAGRCRQRTSGA